MFAAGDLIAGKFQIDRIIGQGGMGFVVAATHVHLGQRVALKFLLPELATDRAIVERFLREARSSAQLRSEHVCRVSDVGVLDTGAPYFVMELLEGRDLASLLTERGPVPVPILTDYVLQACLGLAEAHAARIVHRDLKPANLFLTLRPDGTPLVKIVDFGIAKDPTSANFQLTRTDAVMGSPGYMSPEQLRSTRAADARSDLWALGVILYELSSGRPPFSADSITDLALRIAMDPTPPLRNPAPPGFDQVVYRCLEKDPARRFQDVAQLATALAPFGGPTARERALGVARVLSAASGAGASSPAAVAVAAATTLESSASSLERQRGTRRRWGVMLGTCAAAVVATVGFVRLRGDGAPVEADTGSSSGPASTSPSITTSSVTPASAPPASPEQSPTPLPSNAPPSSAPSASGTASTTPPPAAPPPTAAPPTAAPPAAAPPTAASPTAAQPTAAQPTAASPTAASPAAASPAAPSSPVPASSARPPTASPPITASSKAPPSSAPSSTTRPAPPGAGSRHTASPPPAATSDAVSRPHAAPPVRKAANPRPPNKASSDDFEGSRL